MAMKNRRHKIIRKRPIAALLCLCLLFTLFPATVFAEGEPDNGDTGKAIQLGTSGISGYSATNSYDYIYFGNWEAPDSYTTSGPIKWRVLDDKTNTGDTGLFLLSDALLGTGTNGGVYFQQSFHYDEESDTLYKGSEHDGDHTNCQIANAWQGSDTQGWCSDFYNDNLTTQEQSAVLAATKSDVEFTSNRNNLFTASGNILSGDKVFFLSAEEAETVDYGLTDGSASNTYYGNGVGYWWLRSPAAIDTGIAGVAGGSAGAGVNFLDIGQTARPAFNLNLDSVLFTSAADGGKADTAVDSTLAAVSDYGGSEWKLTLKDNSRNSFTASTNSDTTKDKNYSDWTVDISYENAQTGTNEYVSVLLCDSSDNVLYYGNIAQSSASGTASVAIPSGLAVGSYTLNVFSEQCNGDKKTDLASDFQTIPLTVEDTTAYTLTVELNGGSGGPAGGEYAEGAVIQINAGTRTGYRFSGWTSSNGGSFDDASGASTTFTMPAADTTITANWFSTDAGVTAVSVNGKGGTVNGTTITVVLDYGTTALPTDSGAVSITTADGATVSNLATTDGSEWTFTVTAEDRITTANYTINVSIASDPAAGNQADVAAAKSTIEAHDSWTVEQAIANTEATVKSWIETLLQGMSLNDVTCSVSITNFTAATAGSSADQDGTNGSFTFTVSLSKGTDNTLATDTTAGINGTITATPYQAQSYTVSVSASPAAGGTVNGGGTHIENTSVTVTASANNGYHFVKWTESGNEVNASTSYTFTVTGDRTLVAVFEKDSTPPQPTTYTVEVQTEGSGTAFASPASATAGTIITLTTTANSGYHFKEWQVISGDVTISGDSFTMPAANVIVKAIFEPDDPTPSTEYTVTFDAQGGSVTPATMRTIGGKLPSLPVPSRSSYTFAGWFTQASGGEKVTTATTFTKDATLYAHWNDTGGSGGSGGGGGSSTTYYTLTFETNGGSAIEKVTGKSGDTISLSGYAPTRDGYDFSGWYSDKGLTAKITEIKLNGNKTVYAGWNEHKDNPNTGAGNPFTDVKETDWFYNDVMFVYENGLMAGTSATTFSPYSNTTRAQIAVIFYRLEGSPAVTGRNSFTDVKQEPGTAWYYDAVTWAEQSGVMGGYGDGTFGLNDPVTREQLASIFYRYAQYKGYDVSAAESLDRFTDKDSVSTWAREAFEWAVGSGIINGKENNLLDPKGTATRAEIAAMLHRFIEKYNLAPATGNGGTSGWVRRINSPQTGDSFHIGLWMFALCASGGMLISLLIFKRREEERSRQLV